MATKVLQKSRVVVPKKTTKTAAGKRRNSNNSPKTLAPAGTDVTVRASNQEAQVIYGRMRVGGLNSFVTTNNNSKAYFTLGSSNSVVNLIAVTAGLTGNSITITVVLSGTHSSTTVSVVGTAITVTLHSSSGTSLTTAAQFITAIRASTPASALINVNHGDGDGTGLMAAQSTASLTGGGGTNLYEVITLAGHQIDAVEALFLDNVQVTFGGTPDPRWGTGIWLNNAFMAPFLGGSGTNLVDLNNQLPTSWPSTALQQGCGGVLLITVYNPNTYPSGEPQQEYLVRGKLILDTRTSTTAWSQNAALCVADFLNDPIFGFDIPYSNIDTTALDTAANACDEAVTLAAGGTEPRYQINGAFAASQDKETTLAQLVAAMAGFIVEQGGVYYIYAGKWRGASGLVFTENDLSGNISIQTHVQRSDNFNSVSGTFIDPASGYQPTDFPAVSIAAYVTADGGKKIWEDVTMAFVVSNTQCQRLAKILIEQIRRGSVVTWPGKLSCLQAECGDIVQLTNAQFGLSTQTWEVHESSYVRQDTNLSNDLVMQLTDANVYAWSAEEIPFTQNQTTTLPSPADVAAPTSVTVASDIYQRNDGTQAPRALLAWTISTSIFVQQAGGYEIQFKRHADANWSNAPYVNGLTNFSYLTDIQSGVAYDFQIRSVSPEGYYSAYAQVLNTLITGDTVAPANVTGFTAVVTDRGILTSWNAVADNDAAQYELRVGASWAAGTKIYSVGASGTTYLYQQLAAGTYNLMLKAIDRSGNPSATEATQSVTISAPNAVTGLQVVTVNNNIQLSWLTAETTSLSVIEYDIYKGATFAESVRIGTVFGNLHQYQERAGGDYSYWVVAVDVGNNRSPTANIATTVSIPPDYFIYDQRGLGNANVSSSNYVVVGGSSIAAFEDPNTIWACIGPGTNATETWTDWFTNNGWNTLQDAINAGFDEWLEPGVTSPAFVEFFVDYGQEFASSFIDFLYEQINLGSGNVTVTPSIKVSADNTTYVNYAGASQIFATNFRYVKYRLDIVATDNKAIIEIDGLGAILSLQNSDEYGNFTANASDVGGTIVTLQNKYVKLTHIQVTASNPVATIPQTNFDFTTIDPTQFPVLLFDKTGARVTSVCSYHITGALAAS